MEGFDCIHLTQGRDKGRDVIKAVISLRFPLNGGDEDVLASQEGVHTDPAKLQEMVSVYNNPTPDSPPEEKI
jgi:hypothetical protein